MPEEGGTENPPVTSEMGAQQIVPEDTEEQGEMKVAINGNQEEEINAPNNAKQAVFDEERKQEEEKGVSLEDSPVNEVVEKQEELQENREDEQSEKKSVRTDTERGTNTSVTTEERRDGQEEENQEGTRSLTKPVNINQPNSVEEHKGNDTANPQTTVSPAGQELESEEMAKNEDEVRQTPSPPKVLSAIARFQSQTSSTGFQVKSKARALADPGRPCNTFHSRENAQSYTPCDKPETNNRSEGSEEEDRPLIKVSELKKKFEA